MIDEATAEGIRRAHLHAEVERKGWTAAAVDLVREHARNHLEFMAEDVRLKAYDDGFPRPPAEGAWGQVMRDSAKLGVVANNGKRKARSPGAHGKLMTVWRRN